MTWCPCHGGSDVRCPLRGDPPIAWRVLCACRAVRVRVQDGVRWAFHEPGCELGSFPVSEARVVEPPAPRRERPAPQATLKFPTPKQRA